MREQTYILISEKPDNAVSAGTVKDSSIPLRDVSDSSTESIINAVRFAGYRSRVRDPNTRKIGFGTARISVVIHPPKDGETTSSSTFCVPHGTELYLTDSDTSIPLFFELDKLTVRASRTFDHNGNDTQHIPWVEDATVNAIAFCPDPSYPEFDADMEDPAGFAYMELGQLWIAGLTPAQSNAFVSDDDLAQ